MHVVIVHLLKYVHRNERYTTAMGRYGMDGFSTRLAS